MRRKRGNFISVKIKAKQRKNKIESIKMTVPTMDKLPRVPDAHGDVVDEKIFSDLYIRTSWVDANVALDQIKKVSLFRIFAF